MQENFDNISSEKLLNSNKQIAKLSMGERYDSLDWNVVKSRRDSCSELEDRPYVLSESDFWLLPPIMPSSEKVADHYSELIEGLNLGAGIEQYIDVHMKDPHLFDPLLKMRESVIAEGFDPNEIASEIKGLSPYFLVVLGTGDGRVMKSLIDQFKPHHLVIALSDWHDLATSFWTVDWQKLVDEQQSVRGGKISIARYDDGSDILTFLASECLTGVDHSLVYLPPKGACNSKAHQFKEDVKKEDLVNLITYLGYTIDEINMVWNTWQTLAKQPRVYRKPQKSLGGRMVVCGSGPSLDSNIENLRELSRTHWITACGSNFRTLKSNGIRVDFLALVERADEVLNDVKQVVEESGAGDTRLVMSTTCHHELQDLFCDAMVYFRPALTPLSLFSNSPDEILFYEGPESINAGVALGSALGMDELVLVGVDLGARSLQKIRSDEAVGCVVRDLNVEVPGNFGGTVFTSRLLTDARWTVEACIRNSPSLVVYNASDGVLIKGAEPCRLSDRLSMLTGDEPSILFDDSMLGKWWKATQRYTPKRFLSSWESRRPRAEALALISSLRDLFSSNKSWKPEVIFEVTRLMDLSVTTAAQFPRRVLRSTIHKLVSAVNRQLLVMRCDSEKASNFERSARRILVDLLDPLESELYALCDAVEALPLHPLCNDNENKPLPDRHV